MVRETSEVTVARIWRVTKLEVLAVICLLTILDTACERKDTPKTSQPADRAAASGDRLFQKKVECSRFLVKIEGSLTGPDIRRQKGVLPLNPVVFYSPTLNTCLYIHRSDLQGQTALRPPRKYHVMYASVEDLLTGRTVEQQEFDLTVPEQAEAASNFEQQVLDRYGNAAGGRKQQ